MHSRKYETVAAWWQRWHDVTMIRNAVIKDWITAEEFEEITGEGYGNGI